MGTQYSCRYAVLDISITNKAKTLIFLLYMGLVVSNVIMSINDSYCLYKVTYKLYCRCGFFFKFKILMLMKILSDGQTVIFMKIFLQWFIVRFDLLQISCSHNFFVKEVLRAISCYLVKKDRAIFYDQQQDLFWKSMIYIHLERGLLIPGASFC